MEPRIQYAKTSDGVSVAYAVLGAGPPVVQISHIPGGVHVYSNFPPARAQVDALARQGWQVIRYDGRGTRSSDREVLDFSVEARLRDLNAVVERIGLGRFALLADFQGSFAAIAYAAQHPEHVWAAFVRISAPVPPRTRSQGR